MKHTPGPFKVYRDGTIVVQAVLTKLPGKIPYNKILCDTATSSPEVSYHEQRENAKLFARSAEMEKDIQDLLECLRSFVNPFLDAKDVAIVQFMREGEYTIRMKGEVQRALELIQKHRTLPSNSQ